MDSNWASDCAGNSAHLPPAVLLWSVCLWLMESLFCFCSSKERRKAEAVRRKGDGWLKLERSQTGASRQAKEEDGKGLVSWMMEHSRKWCWKRMLSSIENDLKRQWKGRNGRQVQGENTHKLNRQKRTWISLRSGQQKEQKTRKEQSWRTVQDNNYRPRCWH